jgi:hypothetical protein
MKKLVILIAMLLALGVVIAWISSQELESGQSTEALAPPAEVPTVSEPLVSDALEEVTAARSDPAVRKAQPVAPPPVDSAPQRITVHGFVFSNDGSPVPDARVSLSVGSSWKAPKRRQLSTDENGYWSTDWDVRGEVNRADYDRELRRWKSRGTKRTERDDLIEALEELGYGSSIEDLPELDAHQVAMLTAYVERAAEVQSREPMELKVTARAGKHEHATRTLPLVARRTSKLDTWSSQRASRELLRIDLVLEKRFEFSGKVLYGEAPVPGADVLLFDRDWKFVSATLSDLNGDYAFAAPEPGRFSVHARRENLGAGIAGGIHLGGPFITPETVVHLESGRSTLHGKLVYPDGEPISGVELIAIETGLSTLNSKDPSRPGLAALAQAEAPGGLAMSRGISIDTGEFAMNAMQPGSYIVWIDGFRQALQPEGVFATGVDNRVVLDAHIVRVSPARNSASIPVGARVHLEELLDRELIPGESARHITLPWIQRRLNFVVEPNTRWRVWASNGAEETSRRECTVGERDHVTHVELLLKRDFARERERITKRRSRVRRYEQKPEPAHLRVDLLDEEEVMQACELTLWQVDESGEAKVVVDALSLQPGQHTKPLLAGEYFWAVRKLESDSALESPKMKRANSITLEAGETASLELEEAALEAPPLPEAEQAAAKEQPAEVSDD